MITIYNYYTTYNSAPLRHLKFKLIVIPIEATLEVHIHYAITIFKSYIVMAHRTITMAYVMSKQECYIYIYIYISGCNSS